MISGDENHIDLSFSQFFMNSWRVFCMWTPLVEIIWRWSKLSPFSSLIKSTCLFKWFIMMFFFSISLYTIGILSVHFCSSFLSGMIYFSNSWLILIKDSDVHLSYKISCYSDLISFKKFFSLPYSAYTASWKSFLSEIKAEQSCSNLPNLSTSFS